MRRSLSILLIALITAHSTPAAANTLVVSRVHSGDLVEFEGGFTVHLTGVVVPGRNTQVGWQAFDFTKRRLEGKRVAVFTRSADDTAASIVLGEDGLAFAKISYDKGLSTDIAAQLLERGFARMDPDHLPEGYDHYREIERRARDQKLGIWANP